MASASISTRACGSISRATWTMVVAGRTDSKNSLWTSPTSFQCVDVRHVDPGADDVGRLAAEGLDRGDDDLHRPAGLLPGGRPEPAVGLQAHGPGHEDEVPRADGARVADDGLPGRSGRYALPAVPVGHGQLHVGVMLVCSAEWKGLFEPSGSDSVPGYMQERPEVARGLSPGRWRRPPRCARRDRRGGTPGAGRAGSAPAGPGRAR